jgi:ribosomal-protein-alanine acetyltransferase
VNIRLASAADIPAITQLERNAAMAAHWSPEQYEGLFNGSGVPRIAFVIEEEDTVQGFLVAREIGSEWEIENIAIATRVRRRGLGSQLLGAFLDSARAQGAKEIFLEVRESNQEARTLYEKWAFRPSGRRGGYYRQPEEDALIYRLVCGDISAK